MMDDKIENTKTVLITGGARRIGKALALAFADKNWNVIVHYNSSESSAEKLSNELNHKGIKSYFFQSNLIDQNDTEHKLKNAFEEFSVPDVLINNAGVFPKETKIENISNLMWDETQTINTKSVFYISKLFNDYEKQDSRIINIASLGGQEIWKNRIPYNVSKAANLQLTKALALELAPKISVNSVSPGYTDIPEDPANDASNLMLEKIPMGRFASTNDIFEAVYFFATCTNFITGQNLNVDGGKHL